MASTFNPPPGWPPPPPGWVPPPGWKPDPSWPAAPPGWELWTPAKQGSRWLGILITVTALTLYFACIVLLESALGGPGAFPVEAGWALTLAPFPVLIITGSVLLSRPRHARTGQGILWGLPVAYLLGTVAAYAYVAVMWPSP